MRKWTICVSQISPNKYEIWTPHYGQFFITSQSEDEGILELKSKIQDYLSKWPQQLNEFNNVSKSIRLRRVKSIHPPE